MTSTPNTRPYTVSVVIPAYNIENVVGRAIDSVLAQTHRADEIIVVDDGSTDNTAAIVQAYGDAVSYLRQDNGGVSAACNTGIRAAAGEWIAFLDGDDKWLPERLELQLDLLQRNSHLVWTSCNYIFRSEKSGAHQEFMDSTLADKLLTGAEYFGSFLKVAVQAEGWNRSSMLINRAVFAELGVFEEGLNWGEDIDMWWRIGYRWPQLGYVNKPLAIYYRDRPGSLSAGNAPRYQVKAMNCVFQRHLELAGRYGLADEVTPFMLNKLFRWTYLMYCLGQFDLVRSTVARFEPILPKAYVIMMRLLIGLPEFTIEGGRHLIRLLHYNRLH